MEDIVLSIDKLRLTPIDINDCVKDKLIKYENGAYSDPYDVESLIKDKSRVKSNGEVFTPAHIVSDMLDMTDKAIFEIEGNDDWNFYEFVDSCADANKLRKYIYKTYLEPSCGNGNFLVQVLERKIVASIKVFRLTNDKEEFILNTYRCFTTIYGVDIKGDNIIESKNRMYIRYLNTLNKYNLVLSDKHSEEVKQLAYFIMDRNIQLGDTLKWSYVQDGNAPMFEAEVLRSYKEKPKEEKGSIDDASMSDGVTVSTKVKDGSDENVTKLVKWLRNPDGEKPKYNDKDKYPMLITEWIFNADRLSRRTFEGTELAKEESDQIIFHDITDRVQIRYNNILSDVNTARISEGESVDLSTEIGKASEEYVEPDNIESETSDDIEDDSDDESNGLNENINTKSENTGVEGQMNPPAYNSAEAIAQAASEDSGNLSKKVKAKNEAKETKESGKKTTAKNIKGVTQMPKGGQMSLL